MVTAKQAVNCVITYIREFSEYIPSGDLRLEEIEFDDAAKEWLISLSYPEEPFSSGPKSRRIYKKFRVEGDVSPPSVKSMKNLEVGSAA